MQNKEKIIIIAGPTAVGKTATSIEIAKKFNGEIISADSIQIYQGLDIGSAKVKTEEKEDIVHHMLDIVSPFDNFSTGEYVHKVKNLITEIISKGKTPIIVGGTGLYISSLLFDIGVTCGKDQVYRDELEKIIEKDGLYSLYEKLEEIDPESAKNIHPNQKDRIIRALEIYHITGKRKSETKNSQESNYNYLLIGLYDEREVLYDRINLRVDKMITEGLISEVEGLINQGVNLENQCMQAIGYKETYEYIKGLVTKEEFINKLKQNSRNYAKRQLTWFKKMPNIVWKKYSEKQEIFNLVGDFING